MTVCYLFRLGIPTRRSEGRQWENLPSTDHVVRNSLDFPTHQEGIDSYTTTDIARRMSSAYRVTIELIDSGGLICAIWKLIKIVLFNPTPTPNPTPVQVPHPANCSLTYIQSNELEKVSAALFVETSCCLWFGGPFKSNVCKLIRKTFFRINFNCHPRGAFNK